MNAAAFSPALILAHIAALALISSVLIPAAVPARIAAVAAGIASLLFALLVVGALLFALWSALFIAAQIYILMRERNSAAPAHGPLSPGEHYFHQSAVPFLEPGQAQDMLAIGSEVSAGPDTVLTREGEPVTHLYFLTEGTVEIESGHRRVATVTTGSFVGEIGILTGEPATATAISVSPIRYVVFDKTSLEDLFDADPKIEVALKRGFNRSLRDKLLAANEAISRRN
ncbi:MAG: Crp/Fnr family transcriptional regulator [Alphaproteobacteria bacterium]